MESAARSALTPTDFPVPPLPSPMAERILGVAGRLFYANGIHATGIDRVIAEAGIAKMSLYKHFRSKDALVLAFLARRDERWCGWLAARVDALAARARRPDARILAIFDALGEWFASRDFRGCAFINAAVEFADAGHLVRGAAAAHKARVRDFIEAECRRATLRQPVEAAARLAMIVEGAIITAQLGEPKTAAARAQAIARATLVDFPPIPKKEHA